MLVIIMTILGVALFSLSRIEGGLTIGDAASNQVLYCAEAGLGRAQLDRGPKAQLYGRHLVPSYWIVDPGRRTIDAYALVEGTYRLAARIEGNEPEALPPFLDLPLVPATIWV